MNRIKLLAVGAMFLALIGTLPVHGQTEKSLDQLFSEILDSSESYEEYKVIKTLKLNAFRGAMFDSLKLYRGTIKNLQGELSEVKSDMAEMRSELQAVQQSFNDSQANSEMIGFLWFDVKKLTYSIFLWSLVALLTLCLAIMYGRIKHVCGVVKRVKAAYSKIVEDYRNQRFQATEKQIKLKRELQTALNRLENIQASEQL